MNHYNLKANTRMDECSIVKKNLFDLIQKISIVKGYIEKYKNLWTKCLKNNYEGQIVDEKAQLCQTKQQFKEAVEEREELEKKYDLGECNKIYADENKFIEKASKDCEKNTSTITAQIAFVVR